MDNKKIGKLIASLRKKQNLTQQELGDKVGVGFRAVSKWERGINLPDIGIINNLSKILGISSDELLSGELKEEKDNKTSKKKISTKTKIIISIVLASIIIFTSIFIYHNNKTYVYSIKSVNLDDYYINGQVTFKGAEMSIIINEVGFPDIDFLSTTITNYDYKIKVKDQMIFGYGYTFNGRNIEDELNGQEFSKYFRINYVGKTGLSRKYIKDNNITLFFEFVDEHNQTIIKNIELQLSEKNNKNEK